MELVMETSSINETFSTANVWLLKGKHQSVTWAKYSVFIADTYSSPGTVDFPPQSSVVVNLGEDAEHLAQRVGTPVKRLGMQNIWDLTTQRCGELWWFMMIYDG